jgi:dTDP-4-amino-4,6-dideoxygalactose transaminase
MDEHGLLDLERCRDALSANPRIRAVVPVHLYGQVADLTALGALRDRFELSLVEDCAQCVGATSDGRAAGSAGQLAATSFYPTKNLGALGDGGRWRPTTARWRSAAARCGTTARPASTCTTSSA